MKKAYPLLLTIGIFLIAPFVQAQDNTAELIQSGIQNASVLARAYSAPLSKAFGTDLNTGWLTTGQAFKPGRFEIRLFANAAFVPAKDHTFDVTTVGLNNNVRLAPGSAHLAPTVFGPDKDGPLLNVYATNPTTQKEEGLASINLPQGLGTAVAPIPMAQLNVGLFKETELMIRFIPSSTVRDLRLNLWGLGLKHNLGQWLPVIASLPFQLTAAVAYSSFESSYALDLAPQSGVANPNPADYTTQAVEFNTRAYQALLVASKTWSVFTTYAGLSYSSAATTTVLAGNYPVTVLGEQPPHPKEIRTITNPVQFQQDYRQVGLTGGFRLKLAIFSLNAEGTWANYPTASAGIGLGFN